MVVWNVFCIFAVEMAKHRIATSPPLGQCSVVLSNLSIGYKTKKGLHVVYSGMGASILPGRLTCLLGENGVGKSTLLRTLAGFQPAVSGGVELAGRRLEDYSDRELAQTIGVVLTEKPDVGLMTVYELVALGRSPYTDFWGRLTDEDRAAVGKAIDMVGISRLASRQVATLSDGERQKVMIAKALAQDTAIIFLDEPTAFLDYPSKVDVLLLLRRICHESDKAIFLSTHDLELSLQAADTLWLMTHQDGLITGTPQELAHNGALKRFVEKNSSVTFDEQRLSVTISA